MKQTIPLLLFLSALLMLVSGVMAAQNMETNRLLEISEKALDETRAQLAACETQLENQKQENSVAAGQLKQQLQDALLSLQEANEAVNMQVEQNAQLLRKLQTLEMENASLQSARETLVSQITSAAAAAGAASAPITIPVHTVPPLF